MTAPAFYNKDNRANVMESRDIQIMYLPPKLLNNQINPPKKFPFASASHRFSPFRTLCLGFVAAISASVIPQAISLRDIVLR
jgi:hypothetical protein